MDAVAVLTLSTWSRRLSRAPEASRLLTQADGNVRGHRDRRIDAVGGGYERQALTVQPRQVVDGRTERARLDRRHDPRPENRRGRGREAEQPALRGRGRR